MALITGQNATSTPLLGVKDARRRQPRPDAPSGVGRPFLAVRRSKAEHPPNAKLSKAPVGTVQKLFPDLVDDFPETMPVLQRELDIIETYLGATLDQLIGQSE
jgi:hypothetical protein